MAVTLSGISGTLNAAGVGSGLDVKSLVSQLMRWSSGPEPARHPGSQLLCEIERPRFRQRLPVQPANAAKSLVSASTDAFRTSVSDSTVLTASAAALRSPAATRSP